MLLYTSYEARASPKIKARKNRPSNPTLLWYPNALGATAVLLMEVGSDRKHFKRHYLHILFLCTESFWHRCRWLRTEWRVPYSCSKVQWPEDWDWPCWILKPFFQFENRWMERSESIATSVSMRCWLDQLVVDNTWTYSLEPLNFLAHTLHWNQYPNQFQSHKQQQQQQQQIIYNNNNNILMIIIITATATTIHNNSN